MSAGKIVLLIFGVLILLVGVGVLFAGGTLVGVERAFRDNEGFITTRTIHLQRDSYAVVTQPAHIDLGPDWPWGWVSLATIKVEAASADPQREIFMGIAESDDVQAYLSGVAYDELIEVDIHPFRAAYRAHPGTAAPQAPAAQGFWRASASGAGMQTLKWELEPGEWVLVLMNADGSLGIELQGAVGARVPWLFTVGLGLLIGGVVVLGVAVLMIYFAVRRFPVGAEREEPGAEAAAISGDPFSFKGELGEPLSPWVWLFKWFLLIPHYVILAFLWVGFFVVWVIALFAILFTGRYPRDLFEFSVGVLRWTWRVGFYGYQALGTEEYPPFTLKSVDYPADLIVAYPERLSRGLALVKWWLLAIPHYIVVGFFQGGWGPRRGGLVLILVLFAGVALLFTRRYPRDIFDFVVGMNRWSYRVAAYATLLTDRYPPFRLGE